jgi:hypothetical protein
MFLHASECFFFACYVCMGVMKQKNTKSINLPFPCDLFRWLLEHGADVDPIGGDLKATPLQWAARSGHLYILHLLLRYNADPSILDTQGFNTLHLVTHSSVVMALLYMLHQPVAVDEKDGDGHTALMWAAWQGELRGAKRSKDSWCVNNSLLMRAPQVTQYQSTSSFDTEHPFLPQIQLSSLRYIGQR